jgi:hypothetical protein
MHSRRFHVQFVNRSRGGVADYSATEKEELVDACAVLSEFISNINSARAAVEALPKSLLDCSGARCTFPTSHVPEMLVTQVGNVKMSIVDSTSSISSSFWFTIQFAVYMGKCMLTPWSSLSSRRAVACGAFGHCCVS